LVRRRRRRRGGRERERRERGMTTAAADCLPSQLRRKERKWIYLVLGCHLIYDWELRSCVFDFCLLGFEDG
jgi:hypothetical protein